MIQSDSSFKTGRFAFMAGLWSFMPHNNVGHSNATGQEHINDVSSAHQKEKHILTGRRSSSDCQSDLVFCPLVFWHLSFPRSTSAISKTLAYTFCHSICRGSCNLVLGLSQENSTTRHLKPLVPIKGTTDRGALSVVHR